MEILLVAHRKLIGMVWLYMESCVFNGMLSTGTHTGRDKFEKYVKGHVKNRSRNIEYIGDMQELILSLGTAVLTWSS